YRRPLVICGNSRTAPPLPSPISRESRRSSPVLGVGRDAPHGSQKREGGGGTGGGGARPSSPLTRSLHHQSFYFLRKHIHRPVVFGQLTGHEHERLAANRRAIAVVHFWSHDHIRHSRFVFDQQKDNAFGGLGPLARNDEASDLAFDTVLELVEIAIERQAMR